jgi:hypothetical protein
VRRASLAAFLLLASACHLQMQMFEVRDCEVLYFGTEIPGGGTVNDADWQKFLEEVVTPRFPDGFTTWEATGQWRDKLGVIEHERTHIVQIVGPSEQKIREIIDTYKQRFRQEAVLRVHSRAGIAFR